ncbi:hypothetical protein FRB99_008875 [Tulasnella sp. 403]|nr:hypothetical protein FRB99_008875 [Tulasnella sp. 403]
MQFSHSGRFLVSGSCQYDVLVWSLESGQLKAMFSGHTALTWALDISSDDVFVASGGQDKILQFWDLNQTDHKFASVSLPNRTLASAFVVGAPILAVGIEEHGIWLVEVPTGSIIVKMDVTSMTFLRFSITGHWLVFAGGSGNLTCWSTADLLSDKIKAEEGASTVSKNERKMDTQEPWYKISVAISSDGTWTLSLSTHAVRAFKGTSGVISVGSIPEIDTRKW